MSIDLIRNLYSTFDSKITAARKKFGRPLTFAEKILAVHLDNLEKAECVRGKSYVDLRPDRVAMQDATAQMALLQFMQAGKKKVAVPSTVHCDHLITARAGVGPDMETATKENQEVFEFLRTVSAKYGIGFWKPGAGIIHQVVLENYAFPGGMMIGTDSHTPNAGGLGMIAVGVGGADAVDVMAGFPWEVQYPKLTGVHLKGKLSGWASPKDVILWLCGKLTTKGGTGKIIEYFGEGVASISATGKGTITNMGAELGATCSLFPYDSRMADYLKTTNRADVAALCDKNAAHLAADPEVLANPAKFFDEVIELDLSTLEPYVVGPHSPDRARPVSKFAEEIKANGWPAKLTSALIGSCTNSSYEDIGRTVHVVEQAKKHGLASKSSFWVSPGSDAIFETMKRDGQLQTLESVGAKVLANACGPCIGQWKRDEIKKGDKNSIITSFNRNFQARNDDNPETLAFISSPEIVTAMALAGDLTFNPMKDELTGQDGKRFKLEPPVSRDLPSNGFAGGHSGFIAPPADGSNVTVAVSPTSERLQILSPFAKWDGKDFVNMPILVKAKGKCTTDHISPAGPWLKFRGHLDKISDNMFLGAVNAFSGEQGKGKNQLTGEKGLTFSAIARAYKAAGLGWVAIGDENYGEGSSREHAAMEPRWLGAKAVITRSFARIHQTNLKKQGILPLTFANPADYEKIGEDDRVSLIDLQSLAEGKPVTMVLRKPDGKEEKIELRHTMSTEQIAWFKAGAALNLIGAK